MPGPHSSTAVSTIAKDGTMWTLQRRHIEGDGDLWTLSRSGGPAPAEEWSHQLLAWDEAALTTWLSRLTAAAVAETLAQSFRPGR